MTFMRAALAASLLSVLCACTTDLSTHVGDAAATPFSDLNLIRPAIPPVLEEADQHPYLIPTDQSCAALALEIHRLDQVLGADLDVPASANAPTLIERGGETVQNAAVGALQRTAQGFIPFRTWVRKLTGAESYAKHVAAAIVAGSIRRAFLKGIASSKGCAWPAPATIKATAAGAPQ
jgi:hypothetical protein